MAKQDILKNNKVSPYILPQDEGLLNNLMSRYKEDMLNDFMSGIYAERILEDDICNKGSYEDVLGFYIDLLAPYYTKDQVQGLMLVGGYLWVRWLTIKKETAHMMDSDAKTIMGGGHIYYYELKQTDEGVDIPITLIEDSLSYIEYILYKAGGDR